MDPAREFPWPGGRRAAVSLTFDDARLTQPDAGFALLDRHGLRATFYVGMDRVDQRRPAWRAAVGAGHEIGNHTLAHPCSGNFPFIDADHALELFTLARMEADLRAASEQIEAALGTRPVTFAYPCGETYVGRGRRLRSYIPLVARLFTVGRGYLNETHNDPAFCDLSHAYSYAADATPFAVLRRRIEKAIEAGGWAILTAHEIGVGKGLWMAEETLDRLGAWLAARRDVVWTDTVAAIGAHIARQQRRQAREQG